MTNETTADTTAKGEGERWSPARIFAEEASVLGIDAMGRDPNGDFVEFEDYDTLRAQLEAAEELVVAVESQAEENFQKYVDANEARSDAEARAEAAEADAARYRWLRENEPEQSNVFFENAHEELDAAIDAAKAATP